jgi:hypothetical protein
MKRSIDIEIKKIFDHIDLNKTFLKSQNISFLNSLKKEYYSKRKLSSEGRELFLDLLRKIAVNSISQVNS